MTTICNKCGHHLHIGDYPFCTGSAEDHAAVKRFAVHGDDIPGGLLVPHAICHDDGTPKRFYSKSEMAKEARAKGWVLMGDTPKSTHDRWV